MNPAQPQSPQQPEVKLASLLDSVVDATARGQLEKLVVERESHNLKYKHAELFYDSGLFVAEHNRRDDKPQSAAEVAANRRAGIAQALVRIELGKSMGLSEAESLSGLQVIRNQVAISSSIRASRMMARGWSWDVQWHGEGINCKGCTLWLKWKGQPHMVVCRDAKGVPIQNADGTVKGEQAHVSFLESDALAMKTTLWENGKPRTGSILDKDNWKNTPANMYFARAVSNAQRFWCPDALGEAPSILSTEEAEDGEETAFIPNVQDGGSMEAVKAVAEARIEELRKAAANAAPPATKAEHPLDVYVGMLPKEIFYKVLGAFGFENLDQVSIDVTPDMDIWKALEQEAQDQRRKNRFA